MKSNLERIKYSVNEMQEMLALVNAEVTGVIRMTEISELKALTTEQIKSKFGAFKYKEAGGGRITVTDNWRNENIIPLSINGKKIWCNRLIVHQFAGAFAEILAAGLWEQFDIDGGGCYCARHKNWNTESNLSIHSWGAALDMNPKKYPYNSNAKPDPHIITIFNKWGFLWGGTWKVKDPMHYQWCREYIGGIT